MMLTIAEFAYEGVERKLKSDCSWPVYISAQHVRQVFSSEDGQATTIYLDGVRAPTEVAEDVNFVLDLLEEVGVNLR